MAVHTVQNLNSDISKNKAVHATAASNIKHPLVSLGWQLKLNPCEQTKPFLAVKDITAVILSPGGRYIYT